MKLTQEQKLFVGDAVERATDLYEAYKESDLHVTFSIDNFGKFEVIIYDQSGGSFTRVHESKRVPLIHNDKPNQEVMSKLHEAEAFCANYYAYREKVLSMKIEALNKELAAVRDSAARAPKLPEVEFAEG